MNLPIAKPIRVKFYTKSGERIAFNPKRKISKPRKVEFYMKRTPLKRYREFSRPKFGNIYTEYRGQIYDSKAESQHAMFLDSELRKKRIKGWKRQIPYALEVKGKKIGSYIADFLVTFPDGHSEVQEIKGVFTPLARWKIKHFQFQYPNIRLKIIRV